MSIPHRRHLLRMLLLATPIVALLASGEYVFDRMRPHEAASISLRADLSERELHVIEDGEVVRTYGIAVGSRKHPTPTGSYWTGHIVWNPRWVPPPSKWARKLRPRAGGDPRNPMQGVKIYFREPWYFIHGTNNPGSIGSAASHGCIRMRTRDAKALARRISKHGSVLLVIQK
jgi:lipoprotein-anchoring transpeptidase ErfK/SrfK